MKKWLRRLPLIAFAGAILMGLTYMFMPRPVPVDLATVERGQLRVQVEEDGRTRIRQRYVVTAPLAGKLRRVEWKPGDDLEKIQKAGRPLAVLEPVAPPLLDARARAEAVAREKAARARIDEGNERLDKARKQENFARTEFERVRRSSMAGGSSRQEQDDAELKLRSAEHDLAAAQFAVRVAEFELQQAQAVLKPFLSPGEIEPLVIPAPIPRGKVLHVAQESEGVLAAGTQIIEVGDPDDIEAEIDVLTTDAVKVRDGMRAFLEHWGGPVPLMGYVRLTEPSGFTKKSALGVEEQRVNVIVDFRVPKEYRGQVRDAYRVVARIVVWEQEVTKVPEGALFRLNGERAVYVVVDGHALLRKVKIGQHNGLEAEVLDGLREGDHVVLHPGDKVKDGVAVVPRAEP